MKKPEQTTLGIFLIVTIVKENKIELFSSLNDISLNEIIHSYFQFLIFLFNTIIRNEYIFLSQKNFNFAC